MPKLTVTPKRRAPSTATVIGEPPMPGEGFATLQCGDVVAIIGCRSFEKLLGATKLAVLDQTQWKLAGQFQKAIYDTYAAAKTGGQGNA